MISFKDYLTEDIQKNDLKNIEDMPFDYGHDGVAMAADFLDGLHKTLLNKKTSIKTHVDHQGTQVGFGYDKNGFYITHKGMQAYTPDEIKYLHKDKKLAKKLIAAHDNLRKITPANSKPGGYSGKIIDMDTYLSENVMPFGVAINSDGLGNPLSNHEKSKFGTDPSVYVVNPEAIADPTKYDIDSQFLYQHHKKMAQKTYATMKPESLEITQGHKRDILGYLKQAHLLGVDKPTAEDYGFYLKKKYSVPTDNPMIAAKAAKKYDTLAGQLNGNERHFQNVINLTHHLIGAKDTLRNVLKQNGNKSDVSLIHGNNKTKIKLS